MNGPLSTLLGLSPLGTFDRCPSCHQLCDLDAGCPNCFDVPLPEVLAARARVATAFEVDGGDVLNGHRYIDGDVACFLCGCAMENALRRPCPT